MNETGSADTVGTPCCCDVCGDIPLHVLVLVYFFPCRTEFFSTDPLGQCLQTVFNSAQRGALAALDTITSKVLEVRILIHILTNAKKAVQANDLMCSCFYATRENLGSTMQRNLKARTALAEVVNLAPLPKLVFHCNLFNWEKKRLLVLISQDPEFAPQELSQQLLHDKGAVNNEADEYSTIRTR